MGISQGDNRQWWEELKEWMSDSIHSWGAAQSLLETAPLSNQTLRPTSQFILLTVHSYQLAVVHILYSFSSSFPFHSAACNVILTHSSRHIFDLNPLKVDPVLLWALALVNSTAHLKITHVYLLPPDTSRFMHLYDFTGCVNYVLFPQDIDSEPFKHGNLLEHLCKMKNVC